MAELYVNLDEERYQLDSTQPDSPPYHKYKEHPFREQSSEQFWRYLHIRSFHGGERQTRYLKESDLDNFAYHDGEGIDISTWGELKLQPVLSRGLAVQSATMPMTVSEDGQTLVVGLTTTPYIKYTGDGSTFSSATGTCVSNAAAVTDLITAPNGDMYGVQGTKIIKSTDNGATWTNDTSTGVPTTMVAVEHCAGQLYALGTTYLKYWDGADWESAATYGGTVMCTFQENIYFADNGTLFKWTGQTCFQDDRLPQGFIVTALIPYRKIMWICGYFWVQGAKKGAVFYMVAGHEAHLYSLTHSGTADYRITGVGGSDDEVYIANPKRGGVDRFDLTDGGLSSGPIWGAAGYIPYKSVAYFDGYVAVGRYDNVAGTDGIYIANVANPSTYKSTGWLTTSEYDFDFPHDYKVFKSITVSGKSLAAGEKVQVEYSLDGGTTYYVAGTWYKQATTSATLTLDNVRGRSIKLKLTLTAGTSSLTTPTVTEVRVDAAPLSEGTWNWRMRLLLSRNRQGDAKIEKLEVASDDQRVLDFVDFRGGEYKVVIDDVDIQQRAGMPDSAVVELGLRGV
jgi:hypothetical protein